MNISVKKRLIKVLSVPLYGCEVWILGTINKAEQKFLESFEMWCWRRMLRVNWTERKTTNEVYYMKLTKPGSCLTLKEDGIWLAMLWDKKKSYYIHIEGSIIHYRKEEGRVEDDQERLAAKSWYSMLTNYKEQNRLADDRDGWIIYGKLQNRPQGWNNNKKNKPRRW